MGPFKKISETSIKFVGCKFLRRGDGSVDFLPPTSIFEDTIKVHIEMEILSHKFLRRGKILMANDYVVMDICTRRGIKSFQFNRLFLVVEDNKT
jgi:hypothetical protein